MKYTIKPLEWEDIDDDVTHIATVIMYSYAINSSTLEYTTICAEGEGILHKSPANSLQEAKEACQKHWEEQLKQYLVEAE